MNVCDILQGMILFMASIEDWKKKQIHIGYLIAMAVVSMAGIIIENKSWYEAIVGASIGICMFGLAMLTNEQIGKGDGLLVAAMGCYLGIRECLSIISTASFILCIISVMLIIVKKCRKETRLAFIPIIFTAYMIVKIGYKLE